MALAKSKKGAFFFHNFIIFSSIVLVSFFIIGITLTVFVTGKLSSIALENTKNNALTLSESTSEILSADIIYDNPTAAVVMLCKNIELMADSADYDVFICDGKGRVIVCPHTLKGLNLDNSSNCEIHSSTVIPSTYLQRVKTGSVSEFSKLGETYDSYHCVSMEPIYVKNSYHGFCVVAAPISNSVIDYMEQILLMFIFSALIALVLVTIAVYFLTSRIAKPIKNLETATKCYSSGDFSYRVPEINTNDELAELIIKFNAMANSLSQIENSRRSFVANVSHEFKTPMTTIGGFINGILDGTIPAEKQDYYLKIVASEIKRLSKMVNMMLNISKIETGNIDMNIENVDVSQKLVSTFLGFEQIISEKNIEVSGLEDLAPTFVHADGAMIDQAIYNLVDNAVKFTDIGGKITINTATDKNFIYFAVTNTGRGIPRKDLEKVFERFYKVDQSRSTDVKSTGLGLCLTKRIIDIHNGTITVESEENNYTRFTVKLPK